MKETRTVEIPGEDSGIYHIPGYHNTQQTFCGYVDAYGDTSFHYTEHPVNCRSCISAYNKIKALKFPKGYFEDKP